MEERQGRNFREDINYKKVTLFFAILQISQIHIYRNRRNQRNIPSGSCLRGYGVPRVGLAVRHCYVL